MPFLTEELREAVHQAMPQGLSRNPALRRPLQDGWWLACDLPLWAPEAVPQLQSKLPGWRFGTAPNGWLLLDCPVAPPAPLSCHTGEVACLISLLKRHPDDQPDETALRRLYLAAESGTVQKEARRLHLEWAEKLRLHQPLPGRLLPYLLALPDAKEVTP